MTQPSNITALRNTYQIKVQLQDINPPIWRRLKVDSRITLDALHVAIQSSMGWLDIHLHQFVDRDGNFFRQQGNPDDEFALGFADTSVDESVVLLSDILHQEKDWFTYEYDFGDGWEHRITLEEILPYQAEQVPVACIKGKRACPPEDCGGALGFMHMVKVLQNPDIEPEEYEDIMEWLEEPFYPEAFDLNEVNEELTALFKNADFNNTSAFEKVLQQFSGDSEKESQTNLLSIESDQDIDGIIGSLNETLSIINGMTEMLDDAYEAFEIIANISNDKQVIELARKMMTRLDQ